MISPAAGQRIAKIVPRLASNHDGELVASVRAIERILSQEGQDWHNLAALVENGVAPRPAAFNTSFLRSWRHLPDTWRAHLLSALLRESWLSPWERSFIFSVREKFDRGFALTGKQIAIIDRLAVRASTEVRAA